MKKVLYISGYQLFPANTGAYVRAMNVIKGLVAAGCEVRIYSLTGRSQDYLARSASAEYEVAPNITGYVERRLGLAICQSLSSKLQFPALWLTIYTVIGLFSAKLAQWHSWSDTVIVNDTYLFPYLRRTSGRLRLINSHNRFIDCT
jgi:hypothetical protein